MRCRRFINRKPSIDTKYVSEETCADCGKGKIYYGSRGIAKKIVHGDCPEW